jgi:hypothetical protein
MTQGGLADVISKWPSGVFTYRLAHADLLFVTASICPQAGAWIDQTSTALSVIAQRPAAASRDRRPGRSRSGR